MYSSRAFIWMVTPLCSVWNRDLEVFWFQTNASLPVKELTAKLPEKRGEGRGGVTPYSGACQYVWGPDFHTPLSSCSSGRKHLHCMHIFSQKRFCKSMGIYGSILLGLFRNDTELTVIVFFWDVFWFRNERNSIPPILLPIAELTETDRIAVC